MAAHENTIYLFTDTQSWQGALYFCVPIKLAVGQHLLCGGGKEFNKRSAKLRYLFLTDVTIKKPFLITRALNHAQRGLVSDCVWEVYASVETWKWQFNVVLAWFPHQSCREEGNWVWTWGWTGRRRGRGGGLEERVDPDQQALSPQEVCECVCHWGGRGGALGCGLGNGKVLTVQVSKNRPTA